MSTEEEEALIGMPKLFLRCRRLWTAMYEQAKLLSDLEFGDGEPRLVYTGHITHLADEIGETRPYLGTITRRLRQMGSVQQLDRGGGRGVGRWLILTSPTVEAFNESRE